ncbi:MAG: hypothetical protein NTZ09_11315, partial [Candidatus Hydrogenedentes bacterium]|nr:hypothetical protein [Candidatus Hydrogenedentota bacterium]
WLGLRVLALTINKTLDLPLNAVQQTLELWQNNLQESAVEPQSVKHQMNLKMVAWLNDLLHNNRSAG